MVLSLWYPVSWVAAGLLADEVIGLALPFLVPPNRRSHHVALPRTPPRRRLCGNWVNGFHGRLHAVLAQALPGPLLARQKSISPAVCWCTRLGFLASHVPDSHGPPATFSMGGIGRPRSTGMGITCRMLAWVAARTMASAANPVTRTPAVPGWTCLSRPSSSTPSVPGDL